MKRANGILEQTFMMRNMHWKTLLLSLLFLLFLIFSFLFFFAFETSQQDKLIYTYKASVILKNLNLRD